MCSWGWHLNTGGCRLPRQDWRRWPARLPHLAWSAGSARHTAAPQSCALARASMPGLRHRGLVDRGRRVLLRWHRGGVETTSRDRPAPRSAGRSPRDPRPATAWALHGRDTPPACAPTPRSACWPRAARGPRGGSPPATPEPVQRPTPRDLPVSRPPCCGPRLRRSRGRDAGTPRAGRRLGAPSVRTAGTTAASPEAPPTRGDTAPPHPPPRSALRRARSLRQRVCARYRRGPIPAWRGSW